MNAHATFTPRPGEAAPTIADTSSMWAEMVDSIGPAPLPPRPLWIADVKRAACEHFKVTEAALCAKRRDGLTVYRRQVAMYLCRELTTRSLPEIGLRFGDMDHTTVLHACRKIAARLTDGRDTLLVADVAAIRARVSERKGVAA